MKKRRFCEAVLLAVALTVAGCGFQSTAPSAASPRGSDPALEVIARATAEQDAKPPAPLTQGAAQPGNSWIDRVDIDEVMSNPWALLAAFLAIQWFEIWYFNRTGRKSKTVDDAEAAIQPKLGIVQRVLYWIWRRIYFWKNKDKKDPDREKEEKEK